MEKIFKKLQDKGIEFKLHCYPHGYVIERSGLNDMEICDTPEEALVKLISLTD